MRNNNEFSFLLQFIITVFYCKSRTRLEFLLLLLLLFPGNVNNAGF